MVVHELADDVRQPVRAADAHRVVSGAVEVQRHEEAQPLEVVVEPPLAGGVEHQRPHVLVLVDLVDDLLGRLLLVGAQFAGQVVLLHLDHGLEGRVRPHVGRRRQELVHEAAEQVVGLAIGVGVALRELGDRRARALGVAVDADRAAVGHGHRHDRLGPDEAQPVVLLQPQVLEDGCVVDHRVVDGVGVVQEAGDGHLLGGEAAADLHAPLQHEDLLPRLGHVRSGAQAVRAPADDDAVVRALHGIPPPRTLRNNAVIFAAGDEATQCTCSAAHLRYDKQLDGADTGGRPTGAQAGGGGRHHPTRTAREEPDAAEPEPAAHLLPRGPRGQLRACRRTALHHAAGRHPRHQGAGGLPRGQPLPQSGAGCRADARGRDPVRERPPHLRSGRQVRADAAPNWARRAATSCGWRRPSSSPAT